MMNQVNKTEESGPSDDGEPNHRHHGVHYEYNRLQQHAFLRAAWMGNTVVVRRFLSLDNKVSLSGTNSNGDTALHLACSHGHEEVVRLLLHHHADHEADNKNNNNNNNETRLLDILYQTNHAGSTALHCATDHNRVAIVQLLLDVTKGRRPQNSSPPTFSSASTSAWLNCGDGNRDTALHTAARRGYTHLVHLLAQHAAVDLEIRNHDQQTAAQAASTRELQGYLDRTLLRRTRLPPIQQQLAVLQLAPTETSSSSQTTSNSSSSWQRRLKIRQEACHILFEWLALRESS